jgi:hypothetical protein
MFQNDIDQKDPGNIEDWNNATFAATFCRK